MLSPEPFSCGLYMRPQSTRQQTLAFITLTITNTLASKQTSEQASTDEYSGIYYSCRKTSNRASVNRQLLWHLIHYDYDHSCMYYSCKQTSKRASEQVCFSWLSTFKENSRDLWRDLHCFCKQASKHAGEQVGFSWVSAFMGNG
jgi:hypothetical protein